MADSRVLNTIIERKNGELQDLERFIDVAVRGHQQATKAVQLVDLHERVRKALDEPSPYATPEARAAAEARAARIATYAKTQEESGFPYVHRLATVHLWSLLEAVADELVIESLKSPDKWKDTDTLSKIRGPLLAFRDASPDDQAEFLAESLKQAVGARLQQGVGQLEAILDPVGLGGPVHPDVRKVLLELQQMRNVVVHKNGRVDKRLLEACPWLVLARGDRVPLSGVTTHRYWAASAWYLIALICRWDSNATRVNVLKEIEAQLRTGPIPPPAPPPPPSDPPAAEASPPRAP